MSVRHLHRILMSPHLMTMFAATWIIVPQWANGESNPSATNPPNSICRWHEDFSDATAYLENWVPYGRLANGQWAQGVKGHWPDSQNYARSEWWQVIDGTLRGQNFPDEKHPAGISRRVSGECIRMRFQIKLSPGSTGIVRVFGKAVGKFPPQKTDNHVTALDISETGLHLWHGARLRDPDIEEPSSPQLTEGTPPSKERYHNTVTHQDSENLQLSPDVWHQVTFKVCGKAVTAIVDQEPPLTFLLEVDQPIESLGFEADGDKKSIGCIWLDEITFEPLVAN